MLSNSSKYAINAVLYIAVNASENQKIGVKEVADAIQIPSPFLAKLLQTLAKKNVITSTKGPGGGFFLTEENQKLPLMEVVEHIDGSEKFSMCVLGLKECSEESPCPIHHSVQPFKVSFLHELRHNSIASFAEKVKKGGNLSFYSINPILIRTQ